MDLIERPDNVTRRHPWEAARARFFIRLIQRLGVATTTDGWLDVGAGDAWFAQQLLAVLPASTRMACWDTNYPATAPPELAARAPGIEFSAGRPTGSFGGILMLDVIEHVEDDVGFVRDVITRSLAPGGWVLVSVPAYQALFSSHDRALRHFRRYAPGSIRRVLESAGLAVEVRGGLFHGLLPLRGVQAWREQRRPPSDASTGIGAWQGGERLTKALTMALDTEARMSLAMAARGLPPVPGLTTWAFCRRVSEEAP